MADDTMERRMVEHETSTTGWRNAEKISEMAPMAKSGQDGIHCYRMGYQKIFVFVTTDQEYVWIQPKYEVISSIN